MLSRNSFSQCVGCSGLHDPSKQEYGLSRRDFNIWNTSDALHLSVLRLHRFRPDIVCLVLILRFYLFRYAVELIQVLLSVFLLLLLFVHTITSGIVCAQEMELCMRKAPRRVLFTIYITRELVSTFCYSKNAHNRILKQF